MIVIILHVNMIRKSMFSIAKSDDGKKDGKACSTPEIKARKQFGLWDAKDINNFFKALSEVCFRCICCMALRCFSVLVLCIK